VFHVPFVHPSAALTGQSASAAHRRFDFAARIGSAIVIKVSIEYGENTIALPSPWRSISR
jgi:hypothetical protein